MVQQTFLPAIFADRRPMHTGGRRRKPLSCCCALCKRPLQLPSRLGFLKKQDWEPLAQPCRQLLITVTEDCIACCGAACMLLASLAAAAGCGMHVCMVKRKTCCLSSMVTPWAGSGQHPFNSTAALHRHNMCVSNFRKSHQHLQWSSRPLLLEISHRSLPTAATKYFQRERPGSSIYADPNWDVCTVLNTSEGTLKPRAQPQ